MAERPPPETRTAVVAATLAIGAMVAQIVSGKAARDALFLATFDVALLPRATTAAAFVSVLSAVAAARAMAAWSPARVLPVALGVNAVLYGLEWVLLERAAGVAALTLFGHVSFFGSTLFVALWSLVNESFDPRTAKREVGTIAMGGTLGGALGGFAGWTLGGTAGVPAMLLLLSALNFVCIPPVRLLGRRSLRAPAPPPASMRDGFAAVVRLRYLRQLALLVMLVAATATLLDWVLSARVSAVMKTGPSLVAFFAVFHMSVGLLSFVVQGLFARASLERLGLGGTIALSPIIVILTAPVAFLAPSLATAVVARGGEAWMTSSLYRAGYEVLYTPVPRSQKRPAKMLIDVGLDRLGTATGSCVVMLVLAVVGRFEGVVIGVAALLAVGSLLTARRLNRGYVDALARSLEKGVVRLADGQVFDQATRRTLAESASVGRAALLARIEAERQARAIERADDALEGPPPASGTQLGDSSAEDAELWPEGHQDDFAMSGMHLGFVLRRDRDDEVATSVAELRGSDLEAVRRQLAQDPLRTTVVPVVIDLLGRDDVARDALRALRAAGERITGALVDALLDRERSTVVRRRVPRVLESIGTPRAIDGLLAGLLDPELEVRHQCAWALQQLADRGSREAISNERVTEAVREELDRAQQLLGAGADRAEELQRVVEHCIVVLSIVLESEPLRLAYQALRSNDPTLRGTALEYFENVLPEDVREAGLRVLDGLGPRGRTGRPAAALRQELLLSRG